MKSVEPVIDLLEKLGASFALIGGHAVGLRGHPRMTVDYDLLTADPRVLVLKLSAGGVLDLQNVHILLEVSDRERMVRAVDAWGRVR